MKLRIIIISIFAAVCCSCLNDRINEAAEGIRIVSWGGVGADKADTLYSLAKECGFDTHLGLYRAQESAIASLDAAAGKGIDVIINFPQIKDSTEAAVSLIKNHSALFAYHLKDEPDTTDFGWLSCLRDRIYELDPAHPCYINLLPNWAWGVSEYSEQIEHFASEIDVPFYSFDNYPIIEVDGEAVVREDWYRNLEEFSQMARNHGKPFWGFALAKAHSISKPWPDTVYPEPTLEQLRLQVFSNLLYGAQAIQYFNFTGLVDPVTCEKKPAFDLVRQVNSEIRAYSSVFAGCSVFGVWHIGETIPSGTQPLTSMPHKKIKSLNVRGREGDISFKGGVVSLIENRGDTYLVIQNRDIYNPTALDIEFTSRVKHLTPDGHHRVTQTSLELTPGNIAIFAL